MKKNTSSSTMYKLIKEVKAKPGNGKEKLQRFDPINSPTKKQHSSLIPDVAIDILKHVCPCYSNIPK